MIKNAITHFLKMEGFYIGLHSHFITNIHILHNQIRKCRQIAEFTGLNVHRIFFSICQTLTNGKKIKFWQISMFRKKEMNVNA